MTSKTITLAYPVEWPEGKIETVTMRRPKTKDLRIMDKDFTGEVDRSIALICAVSGLPEAVVDELDAEDFAVLSETVGDFFGTAAPPKDGAA